MGLPMYLSKTNYLSGDIDFAEVFLPCINGFALLFADFLNNLIHQWLSVIITLGGGEAGNFLIQIQIFNKISLPLMEIDRLRVYHPIYAFPVHFPNGGNVLVNLALQQDSLTAGTAQRHKLCRVLAATPDVATGAGKGIPHMIEYIQVRFNGSPLQRSKCIGFFEWQFENSAAQMLKQD